MSTYLLHKVAFFTAALLENDVLCSKRKEPNRSECSALPLFNEYRQSYNAEHYACGVTTT